MKDRLSRRKFLAHSAGIAGALGLGVGRTGEGAAASSEIRLGFVGLGDRGRALLGAAVRVGGAQHLPPVRVVALADPDPRSLRKAFEIAAAAPGAAKDGLRGGLTEMRQPPPYACADFRGLLEAKDVDALFIATPVHLHAAQLEEALAAGKHVYCEKPLARTAEECRRILTKAREAEGNGQIVQVGFQRRYNPRYVESMRFLHGGEAGQVLCVRAQWHTASGPPRDKPWMFQREKSGDTVVEQACHQFDVFNWVFRSPPLKACGLGGLRRGSCDPPGVDTLQQYGAVLEYPGGGKVYHTYLSFAIPDRRFLGIYELAFAERAGLDLGHGLAWVGAGGPRQLAPEGGNDTELAVAGFFQSVATGRPPAASVEVGYRATMAALLCRRAMALESTVDWREIEPT